MWFVYNKVFDQGLLKKGGTKIRISLECLQCQLNQAANMAIKHIADNQDRALFFLQVLRETGNIDENTIAPVLAGKIHRVFRGFTNNSDPYGKDKDFYNQKVLSMEGEFEGFIESAADRFLAAVKLAAAGNVIDFGAIPDLDSATVIGVIQEIMKKEFTSSFLVDLQRDLAAAHRLLYLGDNAGEVVFDKFLIKEIKKLYPELKIFFATRGKPVINDITEHDAKIAGIDQYARVINNGTDYPGTVLSECDRRFLQIFNQADVVISKGQGNFESLVEADRKIYFIFLCKCSYFEKKLGMGKNEIVLYCNKQVE